MPSQSKLIPGPGLLGTTQDQNVSMLGQLIAKNHNENGLLYNRVLHNHAQHGLLAAFALGSGSDRLEEIYKDEIKDLEPCKDSKLGRIMTEAEVDEYLGRADFERDFVTFFQNRRPAPGQDVWPILQYWLLDRANPFLPGLVGGYAHPLIMLADSIELGSATLALDALALTAVDWNALTKLVTMNLPPADSRPESLFEILDMIHGDRSFDGVVPKPGIEHISDIMSNPAAASGVLRYLSLGDKYLLHGNENIQFTGEMVELAIRLLTCTHVPGKPAFDFYLNHNLTFVNCLRILLPVFRTEAAQRTLMRMYWLLTVLAFITQGRPIIAQGWVPEGDAGQTIMGWGQVKAAACEIQGETATHRASDPHFLKAIEIMVTFGKMMPDIESFLLMAANKFVGEFHDWTGFGK